jgi:hypothetical protein
MTIPSFVEYLMMSKTDNVIAQAMKIEESAGFDLGNILSMVNYGTGYEENNTIRATPTNYLSTS